MILFSRRVFLDDFLEDVENENQDLEEQQRIEDFNVSCDEVAKHRHQEVQLGD